MLSVATYAVQVTDDGAEMSEYPAADFHGPVTWPIPRWLAERRKHDEEIARITAERDEARAAARWLYVAWDSATKVEARQKWPWLEAER